MEDDLFFIDENRFNSINEEVQIILVLWELYELMYINSVLEKN
jgi:hypothetical protein